MMSTRKNSNFAYDLCCVLKTAAFIFEYCTNNQPILVFFGIPNPEETWAYLYFSDVKFLHVVAYQILFKSIDYSRSYFLKVQFC